MNMKLFDVHKAKFSRMLAKVEMTFVPNLITYEISFIFFFEKKKQTKSLSIIFQPFGRKNFPRIDDVVFKDKIFPELQEVYRWETAIFIFSIYWWEKIFHERYNYFINAPKSSLEEWKFQFTFFNLFFLSCTGFGHKKP